MRLQELEPVKIEAAHCDFRAAEDFLNCQAGLWRLAVLNNSGYFDGKIDPDTHNTFTAEVEALAVEPEHTFDARSDSKVAAAYLIFPDGSLYFDSNSGDEVWKDAENFAHRHFDDAGTHRGIALENLSEIDIQLLRHCASDANDFGEIADYAEGHTALSECLENFMGSPDFWDGVVSATRAAYNGGGYSVELYPDGHWRVLWDNSIGNLYDSPGVILGLPTFESAYDSSEDGEEDYEMACKNEADAIKEALSFEFDDIAQQMREELKERFRRYSFSV